MARLGKKGIPAATYNSVHHQTLLSVLKDGHYEVVVVLGYVHATGAGDRVVHCCVDDGTGGYAIVWPFN